jgi:Domain of unknown function (DUF4124)
MHRISARIALSLLFALPVVARAEVYRYVDARGDIIYSNVPPGGMPDPDESTSPPRGRPDVPRGRPVAPAGRTSAASPAEFPRVSASAQKDRDTLRRRILEDELRAEQVLQRQAVAKGAADEADAHQRNVRSLERELSYSSR